MLRDQPRAASTPRHWLPRHRRPLLWQHQADREGPDGRVAHLRADPAAPLLARPLVKPLHGQLCSHPGLAPQPPDRDRGPAHAQARDLALVRLGRARGLDHAQARELAPGRGPGHGPDLGPAQVVVAPGRGRVLGPGRHPSKPRPLSAARG